MLQHFPIHWTDQGIVHGAGVLDPHEDPLLTASMSAVVLRWGERWSLELEETWPCAVLHWSHGAIPIRPRSRLFDSTPEAYGRQLEALVAHLEVHAPEKVTARGWLAYPLVPWERASAMPSLPSELPQRPLGDGAFRAGPRPVEELAVAARSPRGSMEAMLDWLGSTPERPFRDQPRALRVGAEHLYAERSDGSVWRVPLSALRSRRGQSDEDAVYVFGRSTRVVLTFRPRPCPVRAHLDALL